MIVTRRRIFKVVLLGDKGVGKETFRLRFLGHGFRRSYGKIIGANFAVKKLSNFLDETIIAQIWEILPQHKFRYIREVYYKGSTGGILIFDISRRDTLENLNHWVMEFKKFNNNVHVPLLIVGSKADLRDKSENAISREEAERFVHGLEKICGIKITYVETSILDNGEIEYGFREFIDNITHHLVFSDEMIDVEVSKFLKKHNKKLKKDLAKFKNEQENRPVHEFTTYIHPKLMKKLNHLATAMGLDVSILLNKILTDFFED